jgi:hypothetical protein
MESDFNTQNKLVVSGNAVNGAISLDENIYSSSDEDENTIPSRY